MELYVLIGEWIQKMGKSDADLNKQAIITAEESDDLAKKLIMMSSQGGYKISLIWLPERMNQQSANKILKLLEEPPRQTLFLLVSEQPELLLETIRSRTQRIDFKKIATEDIEQALIERRALEPNMAHRIARIANGNWNAALEELNAGNEKRQHLDMFIMLMRLALHAQHSRPEEMERSGFHFWKREAEENALITSCTCSGKVSCTTSDNLN